MKYHILVSIEKPLTDELQDELSWNGFLSAISPIQNKAIKGKRLAENVWLFDRDNDSAVFAHVVLAAVRQQRSYSVLYLSSDS